MTDQQERPLEIRNQLFEQFERIDVEVVGGLVHHQQVGGARKEACQQQPVSLSA